MWKMLVCSGRYIGLVIGVAGGKIGGHRLRGMTTGLLKSLFEGEGGNSEYAGADVPV